MPGAVRYIGSQPNELSWSLNGAAHIFESLIAEYVKLNVATADGTITCEQTRAAHDEGCDILVSAGAPFHLLGHDIQLPAGKSAMQVYVEVKTSSQNRLDGNFLVDYTQAVGRMPDVYVLVTNATITPYYQYIAEANWAHHGARFLLTDRWLLARSLIDAGMEPRFASRGVTLPAVDTFPKRPRGISVEYQVSTPPTGPSDRLDVYIAVRNLTSESRRARLDLRSDRGWTSERTAPEIDVILPPSGCKAVKLDYRLTGFNTYSPLQFRVTSEQRTDSILIERDNLRLSLLPPFTGKAHRKIREQLQEIFSLERPDRVISIAGAAGVGKSRILSEALERFHTSRYFVSTFYFSRGGMNEKALLDFFSGLHYEDRSGGSVETRLERFLAHCSSAACLIEYSILIFEDLHHASNRAIRLIKELIDSANLQQRNLYVVITGRNDHTFPNEEYFSLLSYVGYASKFAIARAASIRAFDVAPLSEHDAATLVRSILKDAPPQAIERILRLGESNPWILVEVIQHLLDKGIAHLLSRRTVSIIAPERLHRADAIPPDVLRLQHLRFAGLQDAGEAGVLGRRILIAASFFGFEIEQEVFSAVLESETEEHEAWNLLLERRFVIETDDGRRAFAHENFLHFIRDWVRDPSCLAHRAEACAIIAGRQGIIARLTPHDRGEYFWLLGDAHTAWAYFADIWQRATSMTTVSSEEIDKSFFPYLETLFHLAVTLGEPPSQLVKVCQAMAYMGVHNFPLAQGIAACDRALTLMQEQGLSELAQLSIRQVRAHGLLNMGHSTAAFRQFLEVEADLEEMEEPDLSIAFDLYDRLQEYYRKINHRRLSDKYGRLARLTLNAKPDARLEAAHLITVSVVKLYDSSVFAHQAADDAFVAAQRTDLHRFQIYTRLTQLIASALHPTPASELGRLYEEGVALLEKAQRDNLSDSIMRCELLLATLALSVFDDEDQAKTISTGYANRGLNDSARFGNGLFDWAFHNLLGVISSPRSESDGFRHSMTEQGRRHFESCFETLRSRGLTFIGACDGCYPNIYAISNILRAYLVFGDRIPKELLSHIGVYDDALLSQPRVASIFSAVRAGNILLTANASALGHKSPSKSTGTYMLALRYPMKGGYFTPVF